VTSCGVVHYALLSRDMEFKKIAIADLASALVGYGVSIPAALAGYGVWSLVLGNLATTVTATALYWILCDWRPSHEFDTKEVHSIIGFSLNLSGFSLVNYCCRNADNLIVGRLLGTVELGYYQMAYSLMLYPLQNISSVIGQVLSPAFSKIQSSDSRFRSAYTRASMLIALITFPAMAGMAVVAGPLVITVLGNKWLAVIPLFRILALVGLFQSIQSSTGQIYIAKGRTDRMFWWGIYTGAVFVPAFLIGARWGSVGVAVAYCLAYFVLVAYPCFAIAFDLIGLRVVDYMHALVPQFAITGIMTASCALWLLVLNVLSSSGDWMRLTSTVGVGFVVYSFLMLLIRPRVVWYLEEVLEQLQSRFRCRILTLTRVFSRG
jgi:PST family polysaccharide transporter